MLYLKPEITIIGEASLLFEGFCKDCGVPETPQSVALAYDLDE